MRKVHYLLCALLFCSLILVSCSKTPPDASQVTKKKIALIRLHDLGAANEAPAAIKKGILEAGFKEGIDYEMEILTAQNDMPTLMTIVDSLAVKKIDLVIPLQPYGLYAIMTKKIKLPIVFHLMVNPFDLNIGKSDTDHLENITGSYLYDLDEALKNFLIGLQKIMPKLKILGMLYTPGEVISEKIMKAMVANGSALNIKVVTVPVTDKESLLPAIDILLSKNLDAAVNTHGSTFSPNPEVFIAKAKAKNVPTFGIEKQDVQLGALASLSTDFDEGGIEAGKMIVRILKGESPGKIPLFQMRKPALYVNAELAQRYKVTIPEEYKPYVKPYN
jgi:ABC-type uncharacterized transport system substrate-binding protein